MAGQEGWVWPRGGAQKADLEYSLNFQDSADLNQLAGALTNTAKDVRRSGRVFSDAGIFLDVFDRHAPIHVVQPSPAAARRWPLARLPPQL